MSAFLYLYRCPTTGRNVQGWSADDPSETGEQAYVSVSCLACNRLHMVDPKTGKILGAADE
jgi:hypothetical protein